MLPTDGVTNGQQVTYCELAQLRHARSLPNLLCKSHSSANGTSAGFGRQSSDQHALHKGNTLQSNGSGVEGDYRFFDISPRVPSRTSESYMYVNPNPGPINSLVKGNRNVNNLPLPSSQPETYLTLLGSQETAGQEPQQALPSIYETINEQL